VFKGKTRKQVGERVLEVTDAIDDDISRLLALNILSLTKEQVEALKKEIREAEAALKYWKSTTPGDQYVSDLDALH
jgi:hypothetical protein